jgi:transposase
MGVGTVHDYVQRAQSAGLASWPLPAVPDDELERRLFPIAASTSSEQPADAFAIGGAPPLVAKPLPDWAHVQIELRRKGVTRHLLWEEYRARHPLGYSYSQYCDLYRSYSVASDPRMVQTHKAGERVFVDYAGQTVPVIDPKTGEIREAQIFVGTLGASNFTFMEATWTQNLEDWIGSHVRMLSFFGGAPEIVVPDNLTSGVTSPCRYDPAINHTYQEWAEHFGIAVIPARVRSPRDKAKVESHVQIIERQVLARLRNRTFHSLGELNEAIAEQMDALNRRPFQKLAGSRLELFQSLDAPALRPLPINRYEFARFQKALVSIDYHVAVEKCLYSVPYRLARQDVLVRITSLVIEVLHNGTRVASHQRNFRPGQYSTLDEHMPPNHQAYKESLGWSPDRLIDWARNVGPNTTRSVEMILADSAHPEQRYRRCLGILGLVKKSGAARVEAACSLLLPAGAPTYRSVTRILKTGLDANARKAAPEPSRPLPEHNNIRGAAYYSDYTDYAKKGGRGN